MKHSKIQNELFVGERIAIISHQGTLTENLSCISSPFETEDWDMSFHIGIFDADNLSPWAL